uniref:proline--tRNA ligase n=1 Tax=uncultured Eubacterium sp. TaxID=165185 RepID=UPI0025983972
AIGGNNSHEFTAFSEVGESDILRCPACGYAATDEKTPGVDDPAQDDVAMLPLEKKETPGTKTIEAVCDFLGLDKKQSIKALLFQTLDEETLEVNGYVAAFVRGDREVNMIKIVNALDIPEFCLEFADESKMGPVTGAVGGFTGPMHLHDCKIIVDSELVGMKNMCAGACEKDCHYINVNYGRDYEGDIVTDIKTAQAGDRCPVCGKPLTATKGIEVGQIFKLGTKYSESMGAVFADENQETHPLVMGCYGIGVTRTLAAVVEKYHDENGIVWPMSVAPYHCVIVLVKPKDEEQKKTAEKLHDALEKAGVEVLLDDRDERVGVKFNDADLCGYPIRITVGKKAGEGLVEYKLRREDEVQEITVEEAIEKAVSLVNAEKDGRCFFAGR